MPNTILPGTIVNAEVGAAGPQRYVPSVRVERDIDRPQPSAFPSARRFETLYPLSRASEEATAAGLAAARDHDRSSSSGLLDVLLGRSLDD